MREKKVSRAEIGKYIPDYLIENDMSASQFADMIGASKSSVYAWLHGGKPMPLFYKILLELLEPYYNSF